MRVFVYLVAAACLLATIPSIADETRFDLPEPDRAALERRQLWATYYHIWHARETAGGLPLLDRANRPLTAGLSPRDWCMAGIEGTVLITGPNGAGSTYNHADHDGPRQADCAAILAIDPKQKSWIRATGKTRYRLARGRYGDGVAGYKLIPYRTIAVDRTVIPYGSVVYIPRARGAAITLPSGKTVRHDGYFLAADTGRAIKGTHIDVFIGTERHNPMPELIKSDARFSFDAYLVRDPAITTTLQRLHRQTVNNKQMETAEIPGIQP